jgi:hypothetical protein
MSPLWMVPAQNALPSYAPKVAPRWRGELRGPGFGIFSSGSEKCFVAEEICFVAQHLNERSTIRDSLQKEAP